MVAREVAKGVISCCRSGKDGQRAEGIDGSRRTGTALCDRRRWRGSAGATATGERPGAEGGSHGKCLRGLLTRSNHGGACPSVTREDGGVGRNSCGLTWWSRPVNRRDRDRGAVGCRSGVVAGRDAATWLASRRRTLFPGSPRSVRRSFERRRSPLMFLFGPAPPGPRPARPPGIRRPAATAAAHSSPTL